MKKIGKMGTAPTIKQLRRKPKAATPSPKSSNVQSHAYNPETQDLDVTFHGGRSYRYHGVQPDTAAGLDKAQSKGSFLHSSIIGTHDETRDPKKD